MNKQQVLNTMTEAHRTLCNQRISRLDDDTNREEEIRQKCQLFKQIEHDLKILFSEENPDLGNRFSLRNFKDAKEYLIYLQTAPLNEVREQLFTMMGDLYAMKNEQKLLQDQQKRLTEQANQQIKKIQQQRDNFVNVKAKHSKSRVAFVVITALFLVAVMVLIAVYYLTIDKSNWLYALADCALLTIGLGVDIFALLREIRNDCKEQEAQKQIDFECQKLFENLTVSATVAIENYNIHNNTVSQCGNTGGTQIGVNNGTVNNTKK